MIVAAPPNTIEGTKPITLAAIPDSRAPNSFDEPIKMPLIALMRPRIWSGVVSCIMLPRITTEIESQHPEMNKKNAQIQRLLEMPKAMMARPNPATERKRYFPESVNMGRLAR